MNLKDKVYNLMLSNRRYFNGFQYTVPSPKSYPYQWFWDSCFHAIILSYFSLEDAKKEIYALLSAQFKNGLLPHMIYWEKVKGVAEIDWGTHKNKTSSITQPPVIAYSVLRIFLQDKDKRFLEDVYPKLKRYYLYLLKERDSRRHNLIGIINPDESGEDNSPRFDEALGLPPRHSQRINFQRRVDLFKKNRLCKFDAPNCMKSHFWVKDVPFNVYIIENLNALSKIARYLKKENDEKFFKEKAERVKVAMKKRMLKDGIFYSCFGEDHKFIYVKTWAIFLPMLVGLYTKKQREFLIENYFYNKSEFFTKFLIPTVSKSEPSYDPEGFWRGPVWISVNWFLFRAFKHAGFLKEAEILKSMSVNLIKKEGFREQFHPETGKGMGAKEFSWGGLIVDMNL